MTTNQIEVFYAKALPHSCGTVKLTVDLLYMGDFKEFTGYVTCMPEYDRAMTFDNKKKYNYIYSLIESQISAEVEKWVTQNN
jgi:hypothetical protein